MNTIAAVMGAMVLLFMPVAVFGQDGFSGEEDAREEYGIYRLVIEQLEKGAAVDPETLAGVRIDEERIAGAAIPTGGELLDDYHAKNAETHRLSDAFVLATSQGAGGGIEGRKTAALSRVGFDRNRRYALLVLGVSLFSPEDVMNEGKIVFLEKEGGVWKIAGTTTAWPARLGRLR